MRFLRSRHFIWAWILHAIVFGGLLAFFTQLHRVDRRASIQNQEKCVEDLVGAMAKSIQEVFECRGVSGHWIETILRKGLSPRVCRATVKTPTGDILSTVGEDGPDGAARTVSRVVNILMVPKQGPDHIASYTLELEVIDSDTNAMYFRRTLIYIGLIGVILYIWIRESVTAWLHYERRHTSIAPQSKP